MTLQKDPEQNEPKYLHRHADLAGKRVLEVGCGDGRLTWRYAGVARHVTGIDLDRDSLRVATIERGSDVEDKVAFAQADSVRLPLAGAAFECAILAWSF
jgi:2-polyprenyl-6-hydroxyphenyl methylase/3-demethylubiquinone-9 3-methyltransferase